MEQEGVETGTTAPRIGTSEGENVEQEDKGDATREDDGDAMSRDRFDYDGTYKRVLGTPKGLAQFLRAFDPATAATLRLDTLTPRGSDLFAALPAWYKRIADIVAQVETTNGASSLVAVHLEVQSTRKGKLGARMLDYAMLLHRTLNVPVLPYALVLYRATPAHGYTTYAVRYNGRAHLSVTYYQISLPALDPAAFAVGDAPLVRALSVAMKEPADEAGRRARYRQAIEAVRQELRTNALEDEALLALWTLIHYTTGYRFETDARWSVDWSQEDKEMVQQLNKHWIDEIRGEGEARGKAEGKAEGEIEGSRATLRAIVQARFGAVPAPLAQRIAVADRAALDALIVRVATAASLDAL